MYHVYWLHLAGHTDILNEGYIGVSSQPNERLYEHRYERRTNRHLSHAFDAYGDQIIQTILLVGSKQYCLDVERGLRPTERIGWNIAIGGGIPPSRKGQKNKNKRKITTKIRSNARQATLKYYELNGTDRKSSWWRIVSPSGEIIDTKNIERWCREQGMKNSSFYLSAKTGRKSKLGFSVTRNP